MPGLAARSSIIAAVALVTLGLTRAQQSKVVAHEWGTFTTVAGRDGRAVEWIPLGGPVDLPCFVNVFGVDDATYTGAYPRAGDPGGVYSGKVAGLQLRGGSLPGSNVVIQIRNPLSVAGFSQPLVVIDGVVQTTNAATPGAGASKTNLSDLNPDSVESVEVVRGAAATALFGQRAANGVINVTTKGSVHKPLSEVLPSIKSTAVVPAVPVAQRPTAPAVAQSPVLRGLGRTPFGQAPGVSVLANPLGVPASRAPISAWAANTSGAILTYDQARAQIRGTVRMETPVIYFYSPREERVNVGVEFPKGFISEWYPSAVLSQPTPQQIPLDSNLTSSIMWKNVTIQPNTFPVFKSEAGKSHYYAARETDANPILVNGQYEKFLFYRGVGGFQVPLIATETDDGRISVKNTGKVPVPAVVLFENRDGKIGYRVHGALSGSAQLKPLPLTSNLESLGRDLETMLVAAGMYQKEAHAMVETWRDSWFEEGTRLFYIMPASTVAEVLPLAIVPTPEKIERAFVGRLEIITKETVRRVATALETEDEEMLLRYGRFLGPITDRMMEGAAPATIVSTKNYVNGLFAAFVQRTEKKCK